MMGDEVDFRGERGIIVWTDPLIMKTCGTYVPVGASYRVVGRGGNPPPMPEGVLERIRQYLHGEDEPTGGK